MRLLGIAFFMECVLRPATLAIGRWGNTSLHIWWQIAQMIVLTGVTCWLTIRFAKVELSSLGLRSWKRWSAVERFYFLQTIPLAIVIFSLINSGSLKALWMRSDLPQIGVFAFIPQMIWGVYQEFLYRGMLQSELVRRWGAVRGILASNVIFTLGPLHAYHFLLAKGNPSHLWIFGGIFGIGLFFAILYHRSGNLWIVGIMHGIGDWFIVGLGHALKA